MDTCEVMSVAESGKYIYENSDHIKVGTNTNLILMQANFSHSFFFISKQFLLDDKHIFQNFTYLS